MSLHPWGEPACIDTALAQNCWWQRLQHTASGAGSGVSSGQAKTCCQEGPQCLQPYSGGRAPSAWELAAPTALQSLLPHGNIQPCTACGASTKEASRRGGSSFPLLPQPQCAHTDDGEMWEGFN